MTDVIERRYGEHTICLEAPDLLVVTLCGGVSQAEIEQIIWAREELTAGLDHVLVLCRLGHFTGISMAASRVLSGSPDPRPQAIVFVNASFRQRVIAEMALRAARFFSGPLGRHSFTDSEEEARAWLNDARHTLLSRSAPPAEQAPSAPSAARSKSANDA
ncbi:MAG: STAS/SEC14 domain-containing protein [Polyangiaceae bacterium]|nr:STAS/SEC14 domain-containing protein [Polyangiaceae bacterium]